MAMGDLFDRAVRSAENGKGALALRITMIVALGTGSIIGGDALTEFREFRARYEADAATNKERLTDLSARLYTTEQIERRTETTVQEIKERLGRMDERLLFLERENKKR